MSWYRQFRPKTLAQLHQASSRELLKKAVLRSDPPHAFLLIGPKGIGKTSSARILAKVFNCEKNEKLWEAGKPLVDACGVCPRCVAIDSGSSLSVVELDAASHRGIEDVRSLREQAHLAPPDGKVKVFILDEVHMFTAEAFNALLKMLEEPPAHVRFILATTEPQKIPATIRSRAAVVEFGKASVDDLSLALSQIAEAENIEVSDHDLRRVALEAGGSFRDAVKLFEQVAFGLKKVESADLEVVLSGVSEEVVEKFTKALKAKSTGEVGEVLSQISSLGRGLSSFQRQVLEAMYEQVKSEMVSSEKKKSTRAGELPSSVIESFQMLNALNVAYDPLLPMPDLPFELACLRWCVQEQSRNSSTPAQKQPAMNTSTKPIEQKKIQESTIQKPMARETKVQEVSEKVISEVSEAIEEASDLVSEAVGEIAEVIEVASSEALEQLSAYWQELLASIKPKNPGLEVLLQKAKPLKVEDGVLTIGVAYPLHKERLSGDAQRKVVEAALVSTLHLSGLRVEYVVVEKSTLQKMSGASSSAGSGGGGSDASIGGSDELADSISELVL